MKPQTLTWGSFSIISPPMVTTYVAEEFSDQGIELEPEDSLYVTWTPESDTIGSITTIKHVLSEKIVELVSDHSDPN